MPRQIRITGEMLEAAYASGYRTLADVGREFGVSRERIRQLLTKWMKHGYNFGKLREYERWDIGRVLCSECGSPVDRTTAYHALANNRPSVHHKRCKPNEYPGEGSLYYRKKALGICSQCTKKAMPGHVNCEWHNNYFNTYKRDRAKRDRLEHERLVAGA